MKPNSKGISTIMVISIIAIVVIVGAVAAYYVLTPPALQPAQVTSGGASFPYPLITKWTTQFNILYPQIQISYQSVGSGAGQRNLFSKTFDFAGSDATLTDAQLANYSVVEVPETVGGVVISYNIQGISSGLNFTADVIAKIFQGNITKWNDPAITSLNPTLTLPSQDIVTVHRSDSSGTTNVFSGYLKNASASWVLGQGTTVNWPGGLGGSGNSGVASIIQQTSGSVGYLEFFYAKNNSIPYAAIQNKNGVFIEPSLQSIAAAAQVGAPLLNSEVRTPIWNLAGDSVYPISAFTYLLIYKNLSYMDQAKATAVVKFAWWAIHDGQQYSEALLYPKLPSSVVTIGENILKSITYNGSPLA
jgi:phosphate transport system substrate-binding protein